MLFGTTPSNLKHQKSPCFTEQNKENLSMESIKKGPENTDKMSWFGNMNSMGANSNENGPDSEESSAVFLPLKNITNSSACNGQPNHSFKVKPNLVELKHRKPLIYLHKKYKAEQSHDYFDSKVRTQDQNLMYGNGNNNQIALCKIKRKPVEACLQA